jgi:tryptophan synthase beta chain
VRLIGVEAAGLQGLDTGRTPPACRAGSPGVLHGNRTYLLQDDNGQIIETHSVSAPAWTTPASAPSMPT